MTAQWWRTALGAGRDPSADQEAAITAPATGRHSVNAGAGTGKTSTLALRALYLIETGHIRADQIVVVTFTKKAAAEVGSRITDTIDRAIASGATLGAGVRRVECTTIHALAAGILRDFAFAFGLLAPPRAVSDGEALGIFHQTFVALLNGDLHVDASALPVAEMSLQTLERDFGKLALRLKNHGIAPEVFASRARVEVDRFARQTWGQLWTDGTGRNRGTPKEQHPKVAVTGEQRRREAEREHANITVVTALLEDFDRRLAERGAATYGDLIGLTTRLLRERPAIVTTLRARWRYLLLDESQDTSALQLGFIETLFGKPGDADAAGMMPVGDTRQAIYGFNGADENVMERLAERAEATHPLVVNRRSSQEIVDAAHAVLERAGVITGDALPKLQAAAGAAGLECVRVQAFGEPGETINEHVEREADAIAREVRRLLADVSANPSDIAILVRRRTHAAAYMRALNGYGISAALDRRSGLFVTDEVRDALAWMSWILELGDRQAAVRVLQSPLCGLSDAAMIALTTPKDWLDRFLDNSHDSAIDVDTRVRLDRVRALLADLLTVVAIPLPKAVRRILNELPIATSYARLGETIGAQAIANLRGFEELAAAFADDRPGSRLRDFVADVQRRILYDDDPQEPELDVDGVRILTIHQSKGLEWPYVFVACSTKSQYASAEPTDRVIAYDPASGAFALKLDIDGRETFRWATLKDEHDPETGERRVPSAQTTLLKREAARVFYVAVTRAKKRVYITAPAPEGKNAADHFAAIRNWAQEHEAGIDLSFHRALPPQDQSRAPERSPGKPRIVERTPVAVGPTAAAIRPRMSFSAISAFETCPRMARLRYRLHVPNLREAIPRFVGLDPADDILPTNAARLGSLAHRALELWGRSKIDAAPIGMIDAFSSASLEFADATPIESARALASAERGVTALEDYTLLAVETPFEITVGETRIEGVIDLIARDGRGRLVVVDYKTGRTDAEHYALQMALYRRVAALRYPGEDVAGAILRLTPEAATFSVAVPLPDAELERALADVGSFESDVAKVGTWCDFCAYRESPCMAPIQEANARRTQRTG